jgi:colicin import membrane protein
MSTLAPSDRFEFAPPPTAGLGRSLALAVLAHAVLLAALTWGVSWKSELLPVAVEAELWSALPQEAAPRLVELPPEPVPEPPPTPSQPVVKAPAPPPPPPKVEVQPVLPDPAIALEQEKRRLQKEKQQALEKLEKEKQAQLKLAKLKQEKLEREKAQREADKLQARRQQEKEARDAKEKKAADDKKLTDNKKKLEQAAERKQAEQAAEENKNLETQRQANLQRMAGLAGATGTSNATGTAQRPSGPSASYAGRIRASIKPNIILLDDLAGNPVAEVEVRTAPEGTIVSRKLLKSSGEKSWDDAVLKAIDKTATLPKDVDGRVPPVLVISFRPKD